jgi:hypothetical protein
MRFAIRSVSQHPKYSNASSGFVLELLGLYKGKVLSATKFSPVKFESLGDAGGWFSFSSVIVLVAVRTSHDDQSARLRRSSQNQKNSWTR